MIVIQIDVAVNTISLRILGVTVLLLFLLSLPQHIYDMRVSLMAFVSTFNFLETLSKRAKRIRE